MKVAILCPRRAGVEDRDRLWAYARTWWANDFPDWPIYEGHHDDGPFNRSAALNRAAAEAGDWDVAVLIDCDILVDRQAVLDAVALARATDRMVLAYHERVALNDKGTKEVMGGFRGNWKARDFVQGTYMDACSSCVVVSRKLWDQVHGFDERFVGWGWEDVAFRISCETMSGAPMAKIAATAWHLWHRPSAGNNVKSPTLIANEARANRYKAAHWKGDEVLALILEAPPVPVELPAETRIPRILHRTVPAVTDEDVEGFWSGFSVMHPGWELRTHRDPLDPADWPLTGRLWDRCDTGAQRAGLIRLEALVTHGGVYVDSDVEPYRSLEPLLQLPAFAGWEDAKVVPDAVLACEPGHPAFREMLDRACQSVEAGEGPWESGPGVSTAVLPGRSDVLLLPPGSFYPYHYSERKRRHEDHASANPWAFGAHHWAASWLPPEKRR